jgi:hypothetical protein
MSREANDLSVELFFTLTCMLASRVIAVEARRIAEVTLVLSLATTVRLGAVLVELAAAAIAATPPALYSNLDQTAVQLGTREWVSHDQCHDFLLKID